MARRKGWAELSAPVRRRYERSGINRTAYEGGESLSTARGHAKGRTPERPETADRNPDQFRDYLRRRGRVMTVITTRGVVEVVGMSAADRSTVGKHLNAVETHIQETSNSPTVRNRTGLKKRKSNNLSDFSGSTVQGFQSREKSAPLESFQLETRPVFLNAYAQQTQETFEIVYSDPGASIGGTR